MPWTPLPATKRETVAPFTRAEADLAAERQRSMVLHSGKRSRSSALGTSMPSFAHWSTTAAVPAAGSPESTPPVFRVAVAALVQAKRPSRIPEASSTAADFMPCSARRLRPSRKGSSASSRISSAANVAPAGSISGVAVQFLNPSRTTSSGTCCVRIPMDVAVIFQGLVPRNGIPVTCATDVGQACPL